LREEFYILLLNRANRIYGYYLLSQGGTSGTVVDPKLIFSIALKCNAHGIILAHNHPSGNTKPSEADIQITKKVKEGGKLLEIDVLDHIILTSDSYLSFADEGLM
jgi:DNA repair protein RadC